MSGFAIFIEPTDARQDDIVVTGDWPRKRAARRWAIKNLDHLRGRWWIARHLTAEEAEERIKLFQEAAKEAGADPP